MTSRPKLQMTSFALLIVFFATIGCSVSSAVPLGATATPLPTYTPHPSLTPASTLTAPVADRWKVEILSATKSLKFGTWAYDKEQKAEFLIVTVRYTYLGQEPIEFSPQSIVLLFPNTSSDPGVALAVGYYQPEGVGAVINFGTQSPGLVLTKPGQTKTERLGWSLFSSKDTAYRLFFPETRSIDFTLED